MYTIKQEKAIEIKKRLKIKYACQVIGLSATALSNILNHKVACRKVVAYCITKYVDENAEIEDYFEPVERGE